VPANKDDCRPAKIAHITKAEAAGAAAKRSSKMRRRRSRDARRKRRFVAWNLVSLCRNPGSGTGLVKEEGLRMFWSVAAVCGALAVAPFLIRAVRSRWSSSPEVRAVVQALAIAIVIDLLPLVLMLVRGQRRPVKK
jgi:hypothetical protein